jgi:imidazolonepropionase-like amidohydrolase
VRNRTPCLISMSLLLAASIVYSQEETVAIRAGEILTISGEPIQGGVILLQGGKIADIGAEVVVPPEARVIDASGGVVMPGLVDAGAVAPVRGDRNEQSDEITPSFRIAGALDPKSKALRRILQNGCTTLCILPGGENVIGGLGVVVKPVGPVSNMGEWILKEDAGLRVVMGRDAAAGNRIPRLEPPTNFYFRRPTTTMAVAWMLRKCFFDAQQYAASGATGEADLTVLAAALHGEIPIRVKVRRAIDIRTAMRIADEYQFRVILDECTEGYKMADELARRKIPVVLGPLYCYPTGGNWQSREEGREVHWNNPGLLVQAGVEVAIASNGQDESIGLLTAAAFAVRHGMTRTDALKSITLTPARILQVADRVGSLEKGKDADLLILSGDPLAATSRIQRVILNGKTVYQVD